MSNKQDTSLKIMSKESISRLLKDVRDIIKNPLTSNGIYYMHDDENMLKGYAMIVGPKDTPYFSGYYFFEFCYPTDYPHSPPLVNYCTNGENIRFNPNLYTNKKVCVSLLNTWRGEQWTSCQTISTTLLTLCTLLCENPLLNEPGVTRSDKDFLTYTRIIEYKNIDIAIFQMISKKPGVFPENFNSFYSIMREVFIKNVDDIRRFLEEKAKLHEKEERLTTSLYSMNVLLNYPKLLSKMNDIIAIYH
jgi:ubiquitin-protein ligase